MYKLKYLLFLSIIFIAPIVFADTTYDMTSRITSPVEYNVCGAGSYTGVELNGATHCWNTNVRNYGTLSRVYFNLPAPTGSTFEPDTAYRLSLYMATNDWRNRFGTVVVSPGSSYINNFVDTFTFVSMKQVNITFTVPYGGSTTYQTLWVDLPATNTNTLITGETNWNLNKVTLTKLTSGSGGGSTTPSGPSTTWDDTGIINNNNENTQDIINNNNTNTQDVINNANQNTQEIIDNQNKNTESTNNLLGTCYKNLFNFRKYDNSDSDMTLNNSINGFTINASVYAVYSGFTLSDFCPECRAGKTYYLKGNSTSSNASYIYIGQSWPFNNSLTLTESMLNSYVYFYGEYPAGSGTGTVNISDIAIYEGTSVHPYSSYNEQICSSKLDDVNSAINSSSQSIINNNNSNTEDIINNQNSNTDKQIDSQKVCSTISLDKNSIVLPNSYLIGNGNVLSSTSGNGLSDYISIDNNTNIEIIPPIPSFPQYACFYNFSKEVISCFRQDSIPIIPENAKFIRFTLNSNSNNPLFSISNCKSGNQALNDSINDSNVENGTGQGFFDNFTSQDFGLSQIITIPLNTIQSLTSKSCVPLQVPIPFTNSNINLPCMTEIYETKFPSIYNLWKIVSFGIVAYLIAIDIFHIVKGFKDPESDKVEVLDL